VIVTISCKDNNEAIAVAHELAQEVNHDKWCPPGLSREAPPKTMREREAEETKQAVKQQHDLEAEKKRQAEAAQRSDKKRRAE
jgi:hypothetical protein